MYHDGAAERGQVDQELPVLVLGAEHEVPGAAQADHEGEDQPVQREPEQVAGGQRVVAQRFQGGDEVPWQSSHRPKKRSRTSARQTMRAEPI